MALLKLSFFHFKKNENLTVSARIFTHIASVFLQIKRSHSARTFAKLGCKKGIEHTAQYDSEEIKRTLIKR